RPEVRNAFNEELIAALSALFADPQGARAIILRGAGASFCAGGDLAWMQRAATYTHSQNKADALNLAHMLDNCSRCPAVVIAKVHGAAFGGGAGLVAAADVAVGIEGCKFAFSEVKLGLIAATISTVVVDKIGRGHARSLFATGEIFGTDKAYDIGLIHDKATTDEEAEEVIQKKLKAILAAGPEAVHKSKLLALGAPFTLEETATKLADIRASEEAKEGIAAFLEKRAPNFN
ncbi:MAG: enoyl-CoA hydratase/isomerase family protein, partial [Armatimonadetes bacterium]|nr:enoyl-CoA hydratase/isomerase family protein [Armatimonadota bacterium]